MEQKITLITFGVKNLPKSVAFYKRLGWKAKEQGDVAFFSMGGTVFGLYPKKMLAKDANVGLAGSGFVGITVSQNVKSEKEVDQTLAFAEKVGAVIVKPAKRADWGGYSGYFADPDGYLWEVAYNPYWKIDKQGNVIL